MAPLLQTYLSQLGLAKEVTWGTALVATDFMPCNAPKFEDVVHSVLDTGFRGVAAKDYGYQQGTSFGQGGWDTVFYPDTGGHPLMGITGTDTISGPVAKTGTIAAASAGAVTLTYTLIAGAAPLATETYMIDSGLATEEAVTPTVVSGAGPYTLTVPATKFAHASTAPAASMWTHPLTLAATPPSYCFSDWYQGPFERQYAGCYYNSVDLKWDNSAEFRVTYGVTGKASITTSKPSAVYTTNQLVQSWQGALTLASVANTRLIAGNLTFKRPVELVYGAGSSTATNAVVGPLEVTGKVTFAITDDTELLYYLNNTQPPMSIVWTSGAKSFTVQMTKTVFETPTAIDRSKNYVSVAASVRGIYNATDAGPVKFILVNSRATTY